MNEQAAKTSVSRVLPVLFGFFVMGLVDIVGVATTRSQETFALSETQAGFIGSMIFIWFFVLSIPTAMLMNRIGRKNTVQISNAVTFIGMLIPLIAMWTGNAGFTPYIVAFVMLGIGNTMLQVSLNPLLTNVVKGNSLSSSLTAGQVIKAVSSFLGPFVALFAAKYLGNWQYMFPIYAGVTLVSALWLMATPIKEETPDKAASFGGAFALLGNRVVLLCFLGIVFVVGVDVGLNTVTPKLLIERAGMSSDTATLGSSVYFACRTIGAFIGALLLTRMADMKYYRIHIWIAIAAMAALYFAQGQWPILIMVGLTGYACSSMFSVIFSQALKARPDKANEVSGIMVMGIVGGAVITPLMGWLTDLVHSQIGSLIAISICVLYLLLFSFMVKTKN